jgi:hypothetical protein
LSWEIGIQETHGLRVFENRALRRIFGLRRDKGQEAEENCIMRSLKGG